MDALLMWTEVGGGDIALAEGDLARDTSLATAVILSLFSDGRARPDDPIPDAGTDRRGWWADAFGEQGAIGSRLWTLSREKITPALGLRIETIARESLQWLVRDGLVRRIDVAAERIGRHHIGLQVALQLAGGSAWRPFEVSAGVTYRGIDIAAVIRASEELHQLVHTGMDI